MSVSLGALVSLQPELQRELCEPHYRDLGLVIQLVPDAEGGEPWPLIRWRSGEISMPIPTDLVVISEP